MDTLPVLPALFHSNLRSVKQIFDIKPSGVMFYVDGIKGLFFNIPSGAYNYVKDVLHGEPRFNPDDLLNAGHFVGDIFYEKLGDHREDVRSFSMFNEDEVNYENSLRIAYKTFLELNEKYQSNPENWVVAYAWLQNHPAFYHQTTDTENYWVMDKGLDGLQVHPYEFMGESYVTFAHSTWVEDSYRDDEGNLHTVSRFVKAPASSFLEVDGSTFEEAYVLLAKNVDLFYTLTGENIADSNKEELPS